MADHAAERRALQRAYPKAFEDGRRVGAGVVRGRREPGGYPKGFHAWPLERRNAWWAGANLGYKMTHPDAKGGEDE